MSAPVTLDALAQVPRWVGWRNEFRNGRATKVPYTAGPRLALAKSDDPATWRTRDEAQRWAARHVNGQGGGIGIVLGEQPDGAWIAGIDLDTCRDAGGTFAPWASDVLQRLGTYAEVSPSGTGAKAFFRVRSEVIEPARAAMGTRHGKAWKNGNAEHPPAIELHLGNRYFAVTGEALTDCPSELREVPAETLLWLIREAGPAFKARGSITPAETPMQAASGAPAILARVEASAASSPALRLVLDGLPGKGRSEAAFALGAALKREGFTFEEMAEALRAHPETADWTREKGDANGGRELRRIWDKAEARTDPARGLERPAMSILDRSACPAPALPLEVFGDYLADWIAHAAEGANAPPDYVAMPLLAVASSLLGNARWVVAWKGWAEPPVLWCASVGDPSSGKSPGAAPVTRDVLGIVERHLAKDHPRDLEQWETVASVARAVEKQWEKDVAKAIKNKQPVPERPREATVPPKPSRPRGRVADVTVEKLATIIAAQPKGVLYCRDELAGWLLNLSRYANGGSDRPFWLEAYVGGPMQVDRVKNPDPVFIPHLTVPVFGTIQPERIADVLVGADDGLPSRFLWTWPEARPFRQPIGAGDAEAAAGRLQALADLAMATDAGGDALPHYVHLADDGREVLTDFAREMQTREAEAHGLLKSSLGKARGQALRLAIVLEFLWWTGEGAAARPAPVKVTRRAMQAAAAMMDAYFLPMARRVLGDAAVPADERNARTLADWIMRTRPVRVNVSSIRDDARLAGLRESDPVKAACRFLAEAHWLTCADLPGTPGRPRGDYVVNPAVWDALQ